MFSSRVPSKKQTKPSLCNAVSQTQVVGSGHSQKDLNTLSQHLICAALLQLPQSSPRTVTKASLRVVNCKKKHKGPFHLRNGRAMGKHG